MFASNAVGTHAVKLCPMSNFIPGPSQSRSRPVALAFLRRSLGVFPIVAALSMLWVFASPIMSVPDEPAHTIKAVSVAHGQLNGVSGGQQSDLTIVKVPGYIANLGGQACMAWRATVTADCAPPIQASAQELVDAGTSAGNYNPFYYAVVGLPSQFLSGAKALYAMRGVSALICAVFLSCAIGAAASLRRPFWPTTATLVAVTPMVLFLSGSINPNALEIVTTAALFMSACLVFENCRNLANVRLAMVVVGVSGAVLANTRAMSLLWLACAVGAAVLLYGWKPLLAVFKNRLGLAMMALIALGCALSLAWLVMANSFQSLLGTPTDIPPAQAFARMLDETFEYSTGYVGVMGWLDTPLPGAIMAFWNFAFAAVILGGLSVRRLRSRITVWAGLAAVLLVPAVVQAQAVQDVGYIWQGRYLLALFVLFLLACGVALRTTPAPQGARAKAVSRWLIAGTVGVHLYAFLYVLRRYVVGLQEHTNWSEMFNPMWQPPFSWQGLSLAYLAVLTVGGVVAYKSLLPVGHKLAPKRHSPKENILSV